jgi:hypothetical protein
MNFPELSELIISNQFRATSADDSQPTNEQAHDSGGMVSMGNAPSLHGLQSRAASTERKVAPVLINTPKVALGGEQPSDAFSTVNGQHGIDSARPAAVSHYVAEAPANGATVQSAAVDQGIDDLVSKENQRIWELIQTIYQ